MRRVADLNVRSWRNRNPLNVTSSASHSGWWVGQIGVDHGNGLLYAVFSSDTYGWRAGFTNLVAYKTLHGIDTINEIANRWLGGGAGGNVATYAEVVSAITGIPAGQLIDLQDWTTELKIGPAMAVMEGGHLPWVEADIEAGLKMAGVKP